MSTSSGSGMDAAEAWDQTLLLTHYQHTPQAVVSGMALSALTAYVLWNAAPQQMLLTWLVVVETLMGLRLLVARYFLHGGGRTCWSMLHWRVVTHVQTFTSGLGWGSLGLFYGVIDEPVTRTAVMMTLMGACAGSAALIGALRGTLLTFGVLAMGPLIGVLLTHGALVQTYMGVALVYYVYMVMVKGPSRISLAMAAQHADRCDRDRLVARLEDAERVGQMGHLIWQQASKLSTLSAEAQRQLGFDGPTVTEARQIWNRVIDQDRERVVQLSSQAVARGDLELRFDTTIHGPFGLRDLRVVQRFDYDPQGQIVQTMTTTQDITELKTTQRELHTLAFEDVLTGLVNRAGFTQRLHERPVQAVLMLDLDHFKYVNDTLGHATGDRLLVMMAQRLGTCLRSQDTVARLGGDEFAVLIHDAVDLEQLDRIARRLVEALSAPCRIDDHDIFVSASVGIAVRGCGGEALAATDPDTLMQQADTALFAAKASGRSRHQFHSEDLSQRTRDRVSMEADLRRGLSDRQFSVHFQPKVALVDGRIVGAEALLRWNHPVRGNVSPEDFIPVAEDSGLIVAIGAWVLRDACAAAAEWNRARAPGEPPLCIAVNLSPRQFLNHDLIGTVTTALARTGCRAEWIELEITERLLLDERGQAGETLDGLRAMGLTLAIDDFGTGHSALSYLTKYPISTLKIDKSFMRDITTRTDQAGVVRAIISMGHSLQLGLVAEGVETTEQANFLREQGCELAQGWLFGRPMPRSEFTALLKQHTRTLPA
ncbi:EAL domain-containing protein [Sphaerotilus sp.]|uniref:putative bifunctional diguanylate cyclase/phosphodiesterase n=1 Tax=Sphaerotilus sp. TaxID=2093942 RepID=UPI00286DA445|nr:EAL domain-containing protein [Sphaerotilus sp.]